MAVVVVGAGISRLKVLTDSTYVEGCVNTWRRGWEASRRWTTSNGQPVRNRHLIEHLYQLVDQDHLSVRIVRLSLLNFSIHDGVGFLL